MRKTLAYCCARLYKQFLAYTTQQLQQLGLSYGSLPFILYIGRHPGCTPSGMTADLKLDWGHSQRSITRLVQDGFVTKARSAESGRTYRLNLTPAGQQAFDVSHQVFLDWDMQQLAVFTEEERNQLLALLGRLLPGDMAGEPPEKGE